MSWVQLSEDFSIMIVTSLYFFDEHFSLGHCHLVSLSTLLHVLIVDTRKSEYHLFRLWIKYDVLGELKTVLYFVVEFFFPLAFPVPPTDSLDSTSHSGSWKNIHYTPKSTQEWTTFSFASRLNIFFFSSLIPATQFCVSTGVLVIFCQLNTYLDTSGKRKS